MEMMGLLGSIVVVTAEARLLYSLGKMPPSFLSSSFENKLHGTRQCAAPLYLGVEWIFVVVLHKKKEKRKRKKGRTHRCSMCGPVLKVKRKKKLEGRNSSVGGDRDRGG